MSEYRATRPFADIVAEMRELANRHADDSIRVDKEGDHVAADDLLCEAVRALAPEQLHAEADAIVADFHSLAKWYA